MIIEKNKKMANKCLSVIFIIVNILFAMPSIFYYIEHKTILKFEKKFNEQIYNLCIKCIENSEYLQEKLIKIHESKINEQKEIEEYMQKIKEKEKKKIEFNKNLRNTKSKNSNDFNIHW